MEDTSHKCIFWMIGVVPLLVKAFCYMCLGGGWGDVPLIPEAEKGDIWMLHTRNDGWSVYRWGLYMMPVWWLVCVAGVSWAGPLPARGQMVADWERWMLSHPQQKRLDPRLFVSFSKPFLQIAQAQQQRSLAPQVTEVAALLRTRHVLSAQERKHLMHLGVVFREVGTVGAKRLLSIGSIYPVTLQRPEALLSLAQHPLVTRIEGLPSITGPLAPMHTTRAEVQTNATHRTLHKGLPITGKGVLIGSIDSGIDIFHPMFFRADGPMVSWIDVDKNGAWTPGVDGIDHNNNGEIEPNEKLLCLRARTHGAQLKKIDTLNDTCRVGVDWLYLDTNANGKRDFGPNAGFKESDPGYGELIFVVDDVNKNGRLDPHEKLITLKTSKVKATYMNGVERVRGRDLIQTVVIPTLVGTGAGHGTGSSSIMLGGVRGHTRYTGIAPDAEIVVASQLKTAANGQLQLVVAEALAWVLEQKAQVVLHEYGFWYGKFMDGSSVHEQALDQASQQGVLQIVPTGNLGGNKKHMRVTLPPGKTMSFPITATKPSWFPPHYPFFRQFVLTLLWRGSPAPTLKCKLITPKGQVLDLHSTALGFQPIKDTKMLFTREQQVSSRGTTMLNLKVVGFDEPTQQLLPIQEGGWTLEVETDPTKEVVLHGYMTDDLSGWNLGVHFAKHVTDENLATWPSTADSAVAVGAYAGYDTPAYTSNPEKSGQFRHYSGAGPRIDGRQLLWLTAPDNPIVAMSPLNQGEQVLMGYGQYFVYGGTSGSSPHVAAAAALLKQVHPDWSHEQLKEALRKGALADQEVQADGQVPNHKWGYGKLRIFRSLFGKDPVENLPPSIRYEGPKRFFLGQLPASLSVLVDDKETPKDKLLIEWDAAYDGQWSKPSSDTSLPFPFKEAGAYVVKARVTDEQNTSASVLLALTVEACQEDRDCGAGVLCNQGTCQPGSRPEPAPQEQGLSEPSGADAAAPEPSGSTPEATAPPGPSAGCGCTGGAGSLPHGMGLLWLLGCVCLVVLRLAKSS